MSFYLPFITINFYRRPLVRLLRSNTNNLPFRDFLIFNFSIFGEFLKNSRIEEFLKSSRNATFSDKIKCPKSGNWKNIRRDDFLSFCLGCKIWWLSNQNPRWWFLPCKIPTSRVHIFIKNENTRRKNCED